MGNSLRIFALVLVGIFVGMLLMEPVNAMRVEPASCYVVQTLGVSQSDSVWALLFNTCEPAFQWVPVPKLGVDV